MRLEVADEWARPEQAVVRYRVETVFARSSWDWIGLYRVRLCRKEVTLEEGRGLQALCITGLSRVWSCSARKLLVLGDQNPGFLFP